MAEDTATLKRLFIAIPLPEAVQHALGQIQQNLSNMYRHWHTVNNHHLTLRFIGPCPAARIPILDASLRHISATPFTLAADTLGTFRKREQIIIWAGLRPSTELAALQYQVNSTLNASIGLPLENRPFKPHITLGRIRLPRISSPHYTATYHGESAPAFQPFNPLQFEVAKFTLFSSQLTSDGAIHHIEKEYTLTKRCSAV